MTILKELEPDKYNSKILMKVQHGGSLYIVAVKDVRYSNKYFHQQPYRNIAEAENAYENFLKQEG